MRQYMAIEIAFDRKAMLVALVCVAVCTGCSDASKEVKELRSEIAQLRSEVRDISRKIERRPSFERPPMQSPEMRKKFDEEHKARIEDRRRIHEDRRREMEERRKSRAVPEETSARPVE